MSANLFSKALAAEAVRIATPMVLALIEQAQKQDPNRMVAWVIIFGCNRQLADNELFSGPIGESDRSKWQKDRSYDIFAHNKADLAWRYQQPSHVILRNNPQLLTNGDFKFGGAEYRNGITVGVSGLDWYQDYMIASSIAAIIQALCIRDFENQLKVVDLKNSDTFFLNLPTGQ